MLDEPHPLDIPAFLKRDANNESELTRMANTQTTDENKPRPAKAAAKANGAAKPAAKATAKAADKAKAKPAAKAAPKGKAASKAPKAAKPKAEAAKKDKFGLREGSAKSQAAAMYAEKGGATLEEVKAKVGSVQLNVLNDLEEAGHEVTKKKVEREGQRPVTRYFLKLKKS